MWKSDTGGSQENGSFNQMAQFLETACKEALKAVIKPIKVSFDFDDTLSRHDVQDLANDLINQGIEVWIVTSRFTEERSGNKFDNKDLFKVAEKLNIPKERIVFTNTNPKADFFDGKDFLWHLDDDEWELIEINSRTEVKALDSYIIGWKQPCIDMLNQKRATK
jgi:hypothetical protein